MTLEKRISRTASDGGVVIFAGLELQGSNCRAEAAMKESGHRMAPSVQEWGSWAPLGDGVQP